MKADDGSVQLDWEHSGWDWFDPQTILDGSMDAQCVPRISSSLQRVYFGPNGMFRGSDWLLNRENTAGKLFLETIENLKTDTEHGARVLANEALQGLLKIIKCFKESSNEGKQFPDYWRALKIVAYHFMHSSRPSMSTAIRATLVDALSSISAGMNDDPVNFDRVSAILYAKIKDRASTLDRLAQAFSSQVMSFMESDAPAERLKIITLSSSSSILAALKDLSIQVFGQLSMTISLTIFESRPLCEGARLAADLVTFLNSNESTRSKGEGFPKVEITIVPDTYAMLAFAEPLTSDPAIPTIILLGADRITPSGHVVNKTGSRALADLASLHLTPSTSRVMVLGETDKIAPPARDDCSTYFRVISTAENVVDDGVSAPFSEDEKKRFAERLSKAELRARPNEQHEAKQMYAAWDEKTQSILVPYLEKQKQSVVKVEVDNDYFEFVEARSIDVYVTENGQMSIEEIMEFSVESCKVEEGMFENLYD